jgi:fibronectin-binding autotransporter adhesin
MKLFKCLSAALLVTLILSISVARAADKYWDINGNTPADTGATNDPNGIASGLWSTTDVFWNSDPAGLNGGGTGTYTAWTGGAADRAIFSAGTNANGTGANASTITASALTAGGILIEEGDIIFAGTSTATIAPGGIVEVNAGSTLSANSSVRIGAAVSSATVATVQYKLNGPTAALRSTNTGFAGSFVDGDAQIVLNGGGKFIYDGGAQINIIAAQTGVNAAAIIGTGPLIVDATIGALAIAGAATYTGGTEIIGGELRIRTSNDRLPVGTAVTVTSPGVLNLNGLNQRIGSLTGTGNVGTAAGTLTIQGSASTVFDGALVNTANFNTPPAPASTGTFGRLIKAGSGTITFNGVNDINGSVTLNAGGITVGAAGSLCGDLADLTITGGTLTLNNAAETVENFGGTGGSVVLNGTALTTDPTTNATTANTTYTGVISGTGGSLIKNNTIAGIAKTLSLSGLNTYTGGTTVNGGRVDSNSATGTGSGAVQVNTGGVLGGSGGVTAQSPWLAAPV